MIVSFDAPDALAVVGALFAGEGVAVKLFADQTGIGFRFRERHAEGGYEIGRVTFCTDEAMAKLETLAHDKAEWSSLVSMCSTLRAAFAAWQLLKNARAV